jgi:hypothetical protein
MKNVDPKQESAIQNGASIYSNAWNEVKIAPNITVNIRDKRDFSRFLFSISWWAQVTVTPDERSKIVFKRGTLIGLKELIWYGGHVCPSSRVGEILLWKNAQKNDVKNRTSDIMNNTIPVFNPFDTKVVWFPWIVASRWTSRHHAIEVNKITMIVISLRLELILFTQDSPDPNNESAPKEATNGHGLFSTRWNGLNFSVIILILLCIGK